MGGNGMSFITNLFSWIGDVYGVVPLVDLKHICASSCEQSPPLLLDFNGFKTRILTSTNGESIIECLAEVNAL